MTEPELYQQDWIDDEPMPPVRPKFQELNNLGVVSVVFGVLSILITFSWTLVVLPLTGIVLAWVALFQIKRKPGEYIGREFAVAGLWLSIAFGILGALFFVLGQHKGVPFGYEKVTFSDLKPNEEKNEVIPEIANKLQRDKKKIFIRGFIYPGRKYMDLKEFILVPTVGHCQFCQTELKSTEMIRVKLEGDLTINYKDKLIGVGGKLTVNEKEAAKPFGGIPYEISSPCIR